MTSKEIVQRAFDSLNERDRTTFERFHQEDAILHDAARDIRGIDAIADREFGYFDVFQTSP